MVRTPKRGKRLPSDIPSFLVPSAMAVMGIGLAAILLVFGKNDDATRARAMARPGFIRSVEQVRGPFNNGARPARMVAQAKGTCLRDQLTEIALRAEIAAAESKRPALTRPSETTYRRTGIDLTRFSPEQAKFITKYGEYFDIDPSIAKSCTDVPCVIASGYATTTSNGLLEGLLVYWWYLKMDYVIGTSRVLPGYAKDEYPTEDFKFSRDELGAFWKLSWILPPTFAKLTLRTIHHIPETFPIMENVQFAGGATACAIMEGKTLSIRMKFPCSQYLSPKNGKEHFEQNLFVTTAHELTHALDSTDSNYFFSHSESWRGISGWTKIDGVDFKGHDYGQWKYDPSLEGFVPPPHAKDSPSEDLAETTAFFRLQPDITAGLTKKTKFISEKFFGGRTFTSEGLQAYYQQFIQGRIEPALSEIVEFCVGQGQKTPRPEREGSFSAPRLKLDGGTDDPALASCIEADIDRRVSSAIDELRESEYEACDVFDKDEAAIRDMVMLALSPAASKHVLQRQHLASTVEAKHKLANDLASNIDAREAYLHCALKPDRETCYSAALIDAFDKVAEPYTSAIAGDLASIRMRFLDEYPITKTQLQVIGLFNGSFSDVDEDLAKQAKHRWHTCLALPNETPAQALMPLVLPFTGGTHFVSATILNCLNTAFNDDIIAAIRRSADRSNLVLAHADAIAYLLNLFTPRYLAEFSKLEEEGTAAEDATRMKLLNDFIATAAKKLAADREWTDGLGETRKTANQLWKRCLDRSRIEFDIFAAQNTIPLRFASIEDTRLLFSHANCAALATLVGKAEKEPQ